MKSGDKSFPYLLGWVCGRVRHVSAVLDQHRAMGHVINVDILAADLREIAEKAGGLSELYQQHLELIEGPLRNGGATPRDDGRQGTSSQVVLPVAPKSDDAGGLR